MIHTFFYIKYALIIYLFQCIVKCRIQTSFVSYVVLTPFYTLSHAVVVYKKTFTDSNIFVYEDS